jgi:hypothetical protein
MLHVIVQHQIVPSAERVICMEAQSKLRIGPYTSYYIMWLTPQQGTLELSSVQLLQIFVTHACLIKARSPLGEFVRANSKRVGTDPTFSRRIFSLTNHIAKIFFSLRVARKNSPSGERD